MVSTFECGDIPFKIKQKAAFYHKLPDHCSIFHTEVFAIGKAGLLASNASVKFRVSIYVNSQPTIKAITLFFKSDRSVLESKTAVESVARNKRLHFYWLPGHKSIES